MHNGDDGDVSTPDGDMAHNIMDEGYQNWDADDMEEAHWEHNDVQEATNADDPADDKVEEDVDGGSPDWDNADIDAPGGDNDTAREAHWEDADVNAPGGDLVGEAHWKDAAATKVYDDALEGGPTDTPWPGAGAGKAIDDATVKGDATDSRWIALRPHEVERRALVWHTTPSRQ